MVQGHDEEILARILGTNKFPTELVAEYDIRVRMLHACGGGISLGALGLIDLCRLIGIAGRAGESVATDTVDWQKIKINDALIVLDNGVERVGKFCGRPAPGIISVQFEGDEWVCEFPARLIKPGPSPDPIDTAIAAPETQKMLSDPAAEVKPAELDINTDDDCCKTMKWSLVQEGAPILVGDDMTEGVFISLAKPKGCLIVSIGGRRHVVEASGVFLKQAEPVEIGQ